nr:helix-turn-helix transcriptional regulator [Allomuricauda sp.]
MRKHFGEYIRQLRNHAGLTLTQLGAKLELDSANLSKIENGKRDFDVKRLNLLASVFDLDIEELKLEFLSQVIANEIYENSCSLDVLKLAEQKVNYLRQINTTQEKLEF